MFTTRLAAVAALSLLAGGAHAATLNFDFGTLAYDGTGICSAECVIPNAGPHSFTVAGQTVVATAYTDNMLTTPAFLTLKPGPIGAETGLGQSATAPNPSDSDYEIAANTAVVLDNTGVVGTPLSISIGSLQGGEQAAIYAGPSLTSLTLVGTLTGGDVLQTLGLGAGDAFVEVMGLANQGGSGSSNSVIAEEAFLTDERTSVPEPMSLPLVATAMTGLIVARRRRR